LIGETAEARRTRGHLCTCAWIPERKRLLGQLTMFNDLAYGVALSQPDQGLATVEPSGHLFDPFDHTITKLPFIG